MSENNLPIKLVLPKTTDIVPNTGGGQLKFFGEVTPQLKREITDIQMFSMRMSQSLL